MFHFGAHSHHEVAYMSLVMQYISYVLMDIYALFYGCNGVWVCINIDG